MYGSFQPNFHPPVLPVCPGEQGGRYLSCQDEAERDQHMQQAADAGNAWKVSLMKQSVSYVDSSEGSVGLKSRFI